MNWREYNKIKRQNYTNGLGYRSSPAASIFGHRNLDIFGVKDDYKKRIGRATWAFMDTFAEGYPEKASSETQADVYNLFTLLARNYPCQVCRKTFEKYIESVPPNTCCREGLQNWIAGLKAYVAREMSTNSQNVNY